MKQFGLDKSLDMLQYTFDDMGEIGSVPLLYDGVLPKKFREMLKLEPIHGIIRCMVLRLETGDYMFIHCDDNFFYGIPVYFEPEPNGSV